MAWRSCRSYQFYRLVECNERDFMHVSIGTKWILKNRGLPYDPPLICNVSNNRKSFVLSLSLGVFLLQIIVL